MDSYEWTVNGTDFRIDVRLYPEGILDASGYPAPATELAAEVLRLAEENEALKSGLRAWKKETVAQIRRELLERAPAQIADALMVNGGGEWAARLVLEGSNRADLGGWCQSAVEDAARGALRSALNRICTEEP